MRGSSLAWLPALLGLGLLSPACTYSPHPAEGQQQCFQNRCVDGYVCGFDGYCYTPANLPVAPGTGGVTPVTVATGGVTTVVGTGGKTGTGGVTTVVGTGGKTGTGGITTVVATGGVTSLGGVTSTGGTTTPPNSGSAMTVVDGQARGAMTGYGWIALGSEDTVTDPTCASPKGPITNAVACDLTVWSMTSAYCVSGSLPVVTSSADFTANWGIQIGVASTPVAAGILGQSFASLTATMMGSPQTGLRIVVHRSGDGVGVTYCANMTPGVAVAFSTFNSACWDGSGTKLAAADVPNLDQIGVQVPSSTTTAITITNLCLVGFAFAK